MTDIYITTKEVCAGLHISRSTFYRLKENDPRFPKPIRLSSHCVRYSLTAVNAYCTMIQDEAQAQCGGRS